MFLGIRYHFNLIMLVSHKPSISAYINLQDSKSKLILYFG